MRIFASQYTKDNRTFLNLNSDNRTNRPADLLWKTPGTTASQEPGESGDISWNVPDTEVIGLALNLVNCGDTMKRAREHPLLARLGVSNEDLVFVANVAKNCSQRLAKKKHISNMKYCPCVSPDLGRCFILYV